MDAYRDALRDAGFSNIEIEVTNRVTDLSGVVTNSRGEDECSSEFGLVQYAQSAFEAAVAEVQAECRR